MNEKQRAEGFGLWLPALFLLLGLLIGLQFNLTVPTEYARYMAVGVLAALDAILGAVRSELNKSYSNKLFISGFISNIILAVGLTFLGERLGVDLSLAAVVAFGVRIFDNVAAIRRRFI